MEMIDILIMVFSMLLSFMLGTVAMLFFGGRTALNYLIVKVSRGKKVLLFAKTKFGWRTLVAKKKENTLIWKFDKSPKITNVVDGDISRYMRLDMIFVDADKPASCIKLKEGALYPEDFDPETYSHLLVRALTRPNPDGVDELKKYIVGVLFIVLIILFAVIGLYMKLGDLAPVVASTVI